MEGVVDRSGHAKLGTYPGHVTIQGINLGPLPAANILRREAVQISLQSPAFSRFQPLNRPLNSTKTLKKM